MTERPDQSFPDIPLEDVLDDFLAVDGGPTKDALDSYIRRFPHYEQELTEFAIAHLRMRWTPPVPDLDTETERRLQARGQETIKNVFARFGMKLPDPSAVAQGHTRTTVAGLTPDTELTGIISAATARGIGVRDLAAQLDLNVPLLRKLDLRTFRYASLPARLIERVAAVVQRDIPAVAAYLQGPQIFAASASYRADQAPVLKGQEDFGAAVRMEPGLTPELRALWLS